MFFRSARSEAIPVEAADLLVTAGALVELSAADAREIAAYMSLRKVAMGDVIIREGDSQHNDFMALVLDGEVAVEHSLAPTHEAMVVSVLGPGSLIGELGLIDDSPRSATCIASTALTLAILQRDALMRLMKDRPAVAARLLLAMNKRIADHLREANRKLTSLSQLSKALEQELDAVHSVNRRLLDRIAPTQTVE
ncbi:cyclic nucleotide-binding domain-containing protein [Ottowia sp. SB7-C50]|uniref:cyclic nucleotide-binding domain-containing protein n=1 Tax=Ottowia sp. SB7-C50 TaxID=3081231 RepID=UPI0029543896|nr:cyclic nucleotide-binding domain-containing protein [Ottowia sp. SB7-C50]WOP15314.1 cyclic nucleotide-binding domain-containing protein [Ottowia sp. SB7-C50]